MVPGRRATSNPETGLLTGCDEKSKDVSEALETALTPEVTRQLFEELAEWNEYLETHVPHFGGRSQ